MSKKIIPVVAIHKKTGDIKHFRSIKIAATYSKYFSTNHISEVINKKKNRKSHGGFWWFMRKDLIFEKDGRIIIKATGHEIKLKKDKKDEKK